MLVTAASVVHLKSGESMAFFQQRESSWFKFLEEKNRDHLKNKVSLNVQEFEHVLIVKNPLETSPCLGTPLMQ